MATFKTTGLDDYIAELEKLQGDTHEEISEAVKAGANVVGDAIKSALYGIPIHPDKEYGKPGDPISGLTAQEKQDVIEAFGLAPMRDDNGYINRKAGFDGYSRHKTRKYPNGIPIPLLVRSMESGSTFRRKTPIIRPAVNRAKQAALDAMQQALDESINNTMKEK